jgi:hypothetical protein
MGCKKPIWQRDAKGNPIMVGEETLYDGKLAEVMLRAHAPHKYSPKFQAELSGPGGAPLMPIHSSDHHAS